MTIFGEKFGISLELDEGKLVSLHDGAFKKVVHFSENFSSVLRVDLSNETFTSTVLDPHDQLFDTTNVDVRLSTGIQKKVFSQNMELGVRKLELIQGIDMGQGAIRMSHNIARAMKWQLNIPYEKSDQSENTIILPQNIKISIQTDVLVRYDDDMIIFSIPDGFSQIVFFITSEIPYNQIGKNLLLITKGDETRRDIIAMAPGEAKFYPIVTFVYLQDFKNNITRYEDLFQIGTILALRKQYKEAISYLKKALEAVRAVGDQLKEAEILMSLATTESDSGDHKQAAHDFNYALRIIEEFQYDSLRLGCLLSLSKNLKRLNKYQEALDNQYSILDVMRESQDRLGEAEVLVDISDSLIGLGHVDDAIEFQNAALELRRQINDQIGEANNLMRFGELLINADRTGEAMSCYEQALRIKRNLGDERGVAECLKKMGVAFYSRGKYVKAKTYYEKAKEAFQNQALILEVREIDQLLNKMREHPYPEGGCEICSTRCTPDIVGLAHLDAVDPIFTDPFKRVLREALAEKQMDKVVDLLLETSMQNPNLQGHGINQDAYAFCLIVQATNLHLTQLNPAQREQIVQMVQDALKKRRYSQL